MSITIRKTREDETREVELRDTSWQDPSVLDMPEAPEGYSQRWIRVMIDGKDDYSNISKKIAEGWVFVKHDELPERYKHLAQRESGRYAGYVGVGDLALARIPSERLKARKKHYEQKTRDMMDAVNAQLRKLDDSRMPVYNESKTRTATGRAAHMED